MKNSINIKYAQNIIVFLLVIIKAIIYSIYKSSEIEKYGMYTIAKVNNIFYAEGGM